MAKRNDTLQKKLNKTEHKSDKTHTKIDKLTTKLTKTGAHRTERSIRKSQVIGRKLARSLYRGKKLDDKIMKIKLKIERNQSLMKTSLKDLPRDQIKTGKEIVNNVLRG
jgi:hypothetical protein